MEQIFISLIAGLAGGSIPVLIKYLLDKRKETLSAINIEKRKIYREMLDILQDVLDGKKGSKEKFVQYLNHAWLYSSSEVLSKCYNLMESFPPRGKGAHTEQIGDILKAMRKDVGLSGKDVASLRYIKYQIIYDEEQDKP
jgi:hypothetical protein